MFYFDTMQRLISMQVPAPLTASTVFITQVQKKIQSQLDQNVAERPDLTAPRQNHTRVFVLQSFIKKSLCFASVF